MKEEMSGREAASNSTWRRKVPKGCLQWCMVKEDVMVATDVVNHPVSKQWGPKIRVEPLLWMEK